MLLGIYLALIVGAAVLIFLATTGAANALGRSEESAHAAAAEKRSRSGDDRSEPRYAMDELAIARILGESNSHAHCRILNVSSHGLRVRATREFPKSAQVYVQWGENFFVGTVCHTVLKNGEYIAGLKLLSCNYNRISRIPFLLFKVSTRVSSKPLRTLSHPSAPAPVRS